MRLLNALSSNRQLLIHRTRFVQFARYAILITVVVYAALFGYIVLTRAHNFSDPDTMNFVNIARNISMGRGITQSALGFNEPRFSLHARPPEPLTAQPPLYPICIALISTLGFPQADAALFLSILCYGLILFVVYLLTAEYYDHQVALLSVTALLCYAPLQQVSKTAFSEPLGILWLLITIWVIPKIRKIPQCFIWSLSAGISGGLAFATRYALLFLAPLVIVFILCESQYRLRDIGLFSLGYTTSAIPVVFRNMKLIGIPLPTPNPSNVGLKQNIINTFWAVFGEYYDGISPKQQVIVLIFLLLIFCLFISIRQKFSHTISDVFIHQGRYLLTFWSLGYLIFLIYQRTYTHFDDIDCRLVTPAGVILIVLFAALIVSVIKPKAEIIYWPMLVVLLVMATIEMRVLIRTPEHNLETSIRTSQRLKWVTDHTSNDDLVIGNDIVDIPFYIGRSSAVSFSPYPYSDYLTYNTLMEYTQIHCNEYKHIYLLLQSDSRDQGNWQRLFGPFVSDLVSGKIEKYSGIVSNCQLQDVYVFNILCK